MSWRWYRGCDQVAGDHQFPHSNSHSRRGPMRRSSSPRRRITPDHRPGRIHDDEHRRGHYPAVSRQPWQLRRRSGPGCRPITCGIRGSFPASTRTVGWPVLCQRHRSSAPCRKLTGRFTECRFVAGMRHKSGIRGPPGAGGTPPGRGGLLVELEDCEEGFLGTSTRPDVLHPLLSFFLLCRAAFLPGCVTAVELQVTSLQTI